MEAPQLSEIQQILQMSKFCWGREREKTYMDEPVSWNSFACSLMKLFCCADIWAKMAARRAAAISALRWRAAASAGDSCPGPSADSASIDAPGPSVELLDCGGGL